MSSLRHLLTGGATLSANVKEELLELVPAPADRRRARLLGDGPPGRADVRPLPRRHHRHLRALPHQRRAVRATSARRLEPGDPELGWLAQTGRVPRGYLGDPEKTGPHLPRGRRRAPRGGRRPGPGARRRLASSSSGRDSVTINTGGEKVFAEEVEQALKRHPDVFDVVVVGRPSERWGQEVVAVVQLRDRSRRPPTTTCATAAAEHLARYKLPKAVVRVPVVERSPSGKPDYRWAADQALRTPSSSVWRPMPRRTITLPFARRPRDGRCARCASASTTPRSSSAPRTALWATPHARRARHRASGAPRRSARGRGVGRRRRRRPRAGARLRSGCSTTGPASTRPTRSSRELHHHADGLRLPRTERVVEALVPAILSQKVTGFEAKRRYRQLVERWGEPAPGPGGLQLLPRSDVIAELGYYDLHVIGVEKQRADTLQRACAHATASRRPANGAPGTLRDRLQAIPGIGPWTVGRGRPASRYGDADAVSVGDFHLKHLVAWALAGEPRGTDDRMLELLEPFAGHRGRVCLLIETSGHQRAALRAAPAHPADRPPVAGPLTPSGRRRSG